MMGKTSVDRSVAWTDGKTAAWTDFCSVDVMAVYLGGEWVDLLGNEMAA